VTSTYPTTRISPRGVLASSSRANNGNGGSVWYGRRSRVGSKIRRARVVSEPVTEYIRFEHAITADLNVAAGEQVRWLPRRRASDLALPGSDFWLFDDQLIIFNHFAGDGSWPPDGFATTTDPAVVKP